MGIVTILTVLIAGLAVIIILLLVDTWNGRKIKKLLTEETALSTDKYFELKWRINLIISFTTIAGIIIGFWGYNYQSQISRQLTLLESKTQNIEELTNNLEEEYAALLEKGDLIEKEFDEFDSNIGQVKNEIGRVRNENLRQSQLYIVSDIDILIDSITGRQRFYFVDLKPNNRKKLPIFYDPPVVDIIENEKESSMKIIDVTNRYFEISFKELYWAFGQENAQEKKIKNKFDIWIMNQ